MLKILLDIEAQEYMDFEDPQEFELIPFFLIFPLDYDQNQKPMDSENAKPNHQLKLSTSNGHEFIDFNRIVYVKAQSGYINIVLENARSKIATRALADFERKMPSNYFFKIHKSIIVNCYKVKTVSSGRGGKVILEDGSSLAVSYRRKKDFLRFLTDLKAE